MAGGGDRVGRGRRAGADGRAGRGGGVRGAATTRGGDDLTAAPQPAARTSATLTLVLLSLAHAVIHMQAALMPLIYIAVLDEFHLTERDIGLFIGITTVIAGGMQLSYGWLTRYVARPLLLGGGQVVFGLSMLTAGAASSIGQLLASISAARVGASPQHPVGNAVLSDTFPPDRRGFAISAHISGGNVGTIAVPFIGGALLATLGWNATLALFGLPALVIGLLIIWRVREDGVAYRAQARAAGSFWAQVGAVLRRRDLMNILVASLVSAGGRGLDIAAPFLLLYFSRELGLNHDTTLWLYALLLVGAVVGPILAGIISDRYGRKRVLVAYYLLSAVGISGVIVAGGNLLFLVPLLLPFGTAVFSEGPVLQAFLADRAVGPLRDVAFAVYFTAAFGIGALWAVIIGSLAAGPGYTVVFAVMATSYLAGALFISRVRET